MLTLLAPTQSADNLFHSFTILCEKENCLISSLQYFFANVTPCLLVLLSSLAVKQIFLSIFSYPFNMSSCVVLTVMAEDVSYPKNYSCVKHLAQYYFSPGDNTDEKDLVECGNCTR